MHDQTGFVYSLPDDTPHVSNQDERPPPSDSGLLGLILIALIPATPTGLYHQFVPMIKELSGTAVFDNQDIQLPTKSLSFQIRAARAGLNNLNNHVLLALYKNTNGEYFILLQTAGTHYGPIAREANADNNPQNLQYLVHILNGTPGPCKLSTIELSGFCDSEDILISLHHEFNLKWFIPSLIKYRRFFGEVLLASLPLSFFSFHHAHHLTTAGLEAPVWHCQPVLSGGNHHRCGDHQESGSRTPDAETLGEHAGSLRLSGLTDPESGPDCRTGGKSIKNALTLFIVI